MTAPLFIYNLFPRLYHGPAAWVAALDDICEMGFNAVFVNPFHATGGSGSLYAIADHAAFDGRWGDDPTAADDLRDFLAECYSRGLTVLYDLVANHMAIDTPLVRLRPRWFCQSSGGEPVCPQTWDGGKWVTWSDLAKLDHDAAADDLHHYFLDVCLRHLRIGFHGFRCDAAYHVPPAFWRRLIAAVRAEFPSAPFLAEAFMASDAQTLALAGAGFDHIFNSAKWWDYTASWCLEQYDRLRAVAATVSFPDTHDTNRLMADVGGNTAAFLQRIHFTGFFSQSFMMVSGTEYGFQKRLDCVNTSPSDWERTGRDFRPEVRRMLAVKRSLPALHRDGPATLLPQPNPSVMCLLKEWGNDRAILVVNKDCTGSQHVELVCLSAYLKPGGGVDVSPGPRIAGWVENLCHVLGPGEVKIIAARSFRC